MIVGGMQTANIILPGLLYNKHSLPELIMHYFCLPNDMSIPLTCIISLSYGTEKSLLFKDISALSKLSCYTSSRKYSGIICLYQIAFYISFLRSSAFKSSRIGFTLALKARRKIQLC